ncbi:MAG: hypothetical protein QY309_05365 [Cyclobacteriaceae bacterium]|nr:MAG: hypothetical protein QY309_05365 [Cyclobacteriaceae bacterium]
MINRTTPSPPLQGEESQENVPPRLQTQVPEEQHIIRKNSNSTLSSVGAASHLRKKEIIKTTSDTSLSGEESQETPHLVYKFKLRRSDILLEEFKFNIELRRSGISFKKKKIIRTTPDPSLSGGEFSSPEFISS